MRSLSPTERQSAESKDWLNAVSVRSTRDRRAAKAQRCDHSNRPFSGPGRRQRVTAAPGSLFAAPPFLVPRRDVRAEEENRRKHPMPEELRLDHPAVEVEGRGIASFSPSG